VSADSTTLAGQPIVADGKAAGSWPIAVIAGVAYVLIVICMWGSFATSSGMGYETAFPYMSETSQGGHGFLYEADPLRIFTNVFYHLSYLLSALLGIRGSFTAYQIVYAALWWGRGMLMFLIIRRLAPNSAILPFSIGALTLVHASDGALQWIGQINQFGFIFWMLLAVYTLVVALQRVTAFRAAVYVALACCFEYLCLWSYESPLFILVSAPIVLAFLVRPKSRSRALLLVAVWYAVPLRYLYLTYLRYSSAGGGTYQATVIRKTWSAYAILSDLAFNVQYSLSFWSWNPADPHMQADRILFLSAGAVGIFVLAGLIVAYLRKSRGIHSEPIRNSRLWVLLATGVVFLVLSFPAYLLLGETRNSWRTQFLSGIGTAIVFGVAISLLARLIPDRRFQSVFAIILAAPLIWLGADTAIERGGYHRWLWQRHLRGVQEVLRAAPRVQDGTVVVMVGVPKATDPFGDDYWFDMALRLAYPRTQVAGVYYYEDGTANPGDNLDLQGRQWEWNVKHFGSLIRSAAVDKTLVLEYEADGIAKVLPSIPPFVCMEPCDDREYVPGTRIIGARPSPEALRRYGPL
jgi:hypothetical protein